MQKEANLSVEQFNIEGVACWDDYIILLNRGFNNLFLIEKKDFRKYLMDDKKKPDMIVNNYELPSVKRLTAGFSGCCLVQNEDLLLFTSSIENTPDWISNGEILDSYIGIIDLKDPYYTTPICVPVIENQKITLDKVESIVNIRKTENTLYVLVVTDNDDGKSELLEIEFRK